MGGVGGWGLYFVWRRGVVVSLYMGVTCCIEAVSGVPYCPVDPGTWEGLGDVLRLVWVGGPV